MFKSLVKVGLVLGLMMSSLSASDLSWQIFADTIESNPKQYCHKQYPSDVFVKVGSKRGIPKCSNYGNGKLSANVNVKLNSPIVLNRETLTDFLSTASALGFNKSNCTPFNGGMVCKGRYSGYSVYWRMIKGKDTLNLEISNI